MVTDKKLGFIGAGNMGEALFKGLLNTKAAKLLSAEGDRDAQIARAEGDRQSEILRASGNAQAIATQFKAINDAGVSPQILALKYIEALKDIAGTQGTSKVFIPYEATALLGALGTLGEAVGVQALPKPKG